MRAFKTIPYCFVKTIKLSKGTIQRLVWIDWYFAHGKKARATMRHFNLSPTVFYRWMRRYKKYDLRSIEDDTGNRRPKHLRQMKTPQSVIDLVCTIRANDLEKSKYEIQAELRDLGIEIGYNTIQKIINRHPELLNTQHLRRVRLHRKRAITRIKAAKELREQYPGSLVQIDTKHLYILGKRFYLFVACDCKSRSGFIWCYQTASSASAADFLQRVVVYFSFTIEAVQTDNGSEYLLNFHKACQGLSIGHYFTDPYCPKQNGRVERLIQTAIYEFFNWQDDLLPDVDMINTRCAIFNDKYNNRRYHQAIGYRIPAIYVKTLLTLREEVSVT